MAMELVRVTEAAAISAARYMGVGNKEIGDQAAVDAMRAVLETVDIDGVVIIGEGEKDEAPMLYNGEKVGNGHGPKMDVAVDPVEGTRLLANGTPNSIAVIAASASGSMWVPEDSLYMKKIVVEERAKDVIDITDSPTANLERIAHALDRDVHELTVFVLDKPKVIIYHNSGNNQHDRCNKLEDNQSAAQNAGCTAAVQIPFEHANR